MPDKNPRQRPQSKRPAEVDVFSVGQWRDDGPLDGAKPLVRSAFASDSGRSGVMKHIANPKEFWKMSSKRKQRFYNEALFMKRVNGSSGVLPIWDIDEAHDNQPRWYVMPKARLLCEIYDENATVLDVVTHIATIARTLSHLADQRIYHRDIKPDNLFWYNGGPVLADFGIAAFPNPPAGLTREGEKLGPANFIAPEMRSANTNATDSSRADVYSLAKTLFVLAHPRRGNYPPDGTHRVDAEEFSLGTLGSAGATVSLGHVLEAATQYRVADRLTMIEFHTELHTWLTRNADRAEHFKALVTSSHRIGFTPYMTTRHRRDVEVIQQIMKVGISRIAEALIGNTTAWRKESHDDESRFELLGDYGWPPNSEDGFEPDDILWMTTHLHDGQRVVLAGVIERRVCFVAEAHHGGPPWTLRKQWGPTTWLRPRMPSAESDLQRLVDAIVGHISPPTPT